MMPSDLDAHVKYTHHVEKLNTTKRLRIILLITRLSLYRGSYTLVPSLPLPMLSASSLTADFPR